MSGVRRPCIERLPDGRGCPNYALPDKSRCEDHERGRGKQRWAEGKTGKRPGWRKGWDRLRSQVWREQGERCNRCRRKVERFELHHIDGVADGSRDVRENVEALCHDCHVAAQAELRVAARERREARDPRRR